MSKIASKQIPDSSGNVTKPDQFHFSSRCCFRIAKGWLGCRDMNRFSTPPTEWPSPQKHVFFTLFQIWCPKLLGNRCLTAPGILRSQDEFHFSFRRCFRIGKISLSCRDMNRFSTQSTPVALTQKACFFVAFSTSVSKIPRKQIPDSSGNVTKPRRISFFFPALLSDWQNLA